MTDDFIRPPRKRSIFSLIGDLPTLLMEQVRNEIEQLKRELTTKLKHAGVGIGLIAVAASFAFFAIGVLITAAVLALALVLPAWAAALIVFGLLLLFAALLAGIGANELKRGTPNPEKTLASIREDVDALKGTGKKDTL
jgi:hypothetical protein